MRFWGGKALLKCRSRWKKTFALERQKVIEAEVEKLLEAKFIEEMEYPKWLANIVVVKKSNNKLMEVVCGLYQSN